MNKAQINKYEFFTLFNICILANDKISGIYGAVLKQDKFWASLISIILSMFIFSIYYLLFKRLLYQDISNAIISLLGKTVGKFILLIYALYFLFLASLDTRDITQLIERYLLPTTPKYLLIIVFLIPIVYLVHHGIEVLARVSQIIFSVMFFIFVFFTTLVLTVNFDEIDFTNFLPILEINKTFFLFNSFQMSYSIPFGEFFVIIFILTHINSKKVLGTGLLSQLLAGFIITFIVVLNVIILHPFTMQYTLSPSLRISRRIDVENLIQRFDMITLVLIMSLSLIKTAVFFFVSKVCISKVIKTQKDYLYLFGFSIIVLLTSLYFIPNYLLLIKLQKDIIIPYIKLTFELLIPFLLFIMTFIKKTKKGENNG